VIKLDYDIGGLNADAREACAQNRWSGYPHFAANSPGDAKLGLKRFPSRPRRLVSGIDSILRSSGARDGARKRHVSPRVALIKRHARWDQGPHTPSFVPGCRSGAYSSQSSALAGWVPSADFATMLPPSGPILRDPSQGIKAISVSTVSEHRPSVRNHPPEGRDSSLPPVAQSSRQRSGDGLREPGTAVWSVSTDEEGNWRASGYNIALHDTYFTSGGVRPRRTM
jgi:hypothetical protein